MLLEACRVLLEIFVMGIYAAMLAHIWFETLGDAATPQSEFKQTAPNVWRRIERMK